MYYLPKFLELLFMSHFNFICDYNSELILTGSVKIPLEVLK